MFDLVPTIIQGGAVGLALAALGIVYALIRLTSNHFVHFAELLAAIGEKLDRLIAATERRNGDSRGRSD